jgi:hypothetical protein
MLYTDIAPVSYRSNRGSFPAMRTTDIPEREQSQGQRSSHTQCDGRNASAGPCQYSSGAFDTYS